MTPKTASRNGLRIASACGAAVALAACLGTDTADQSFSNHSDPSKADYTARVSHPQRAAKADAKPSRIRGKIESGAQKHLDKTPATYPVGYVLNI
jgi:hypothetical protein